MATDQLFTRRKRKRKNGKSEIKSEEFMNENWKILNDENEFSSSGGNFCGLEELTSYNEDELQAFLSSSSSAAPSKEKAEKRKKNEENELHSINKTEHKEITLTCNKEEQLVLADEVVTTVNNNEDKIQTKLSRKERKKTQYKQKRLQKLKEKQKKKKLQKKKEAQFDNDCHQQSQQEEINWKHQIINAEISKIDYSNELPDWHELGVPNEILKSLSELKFVNPTEIQKKCLPHAILNHKDVLGAAETGSGKTLAFGIPVISNIMQIKKRQAEKNKHNTTLKALIITPTRELAIQIQSHLKAISKYTSITSCVVVGGLATEKQQRLLNKFPDIVIATPGRLSQLISDGNEHLANLTKLKFLVIDECDRLFERGHFKDLNEILEKINKSAESSTHGTRQNFIFSATLTLQDSSRRGKDGDDFQNLFKKIGLSPRAVTVDLTQKHVTATTLTQMKVMCNNEEKESYLAYFLLNHKGRTILFTNTISETKKLCSILDVLKQNPLQLHAGKQQRQRLKCLERFRSRGDGLLVCTDVAARGLDIPDVDNVVHFRLPKDPKIYVHRSGRTARAKKDGLSLILEGPEDFQSYRKISNVLSLESDLPTMPVDRGLFDAISERVRLAKDIEKLQFRSRKEASDKSWTKRFSEALDIEDNSSNVSSSSENKREKMLLNQKQAELNRLLKMKLFSSYFSGNYPTRNRSIVIPTILAMK